MAEKLEKENVSEQLRLQIDENLRHVYLGMLQQHVPERFSILLEALRQKGAAS